MVSRIARRRSGQLSRATTGQSGSSARTGAFSPGSLDADLVDKPGEGVGQVDLLGRVALGV